MTYTIRVDGRGREVLISSVKVIKNNLESLILSGDVTTETIQQHEELLQLHRGLLYLHADPEPEVEEPVVGPEAGINQHPQLDELPN